MTEEEIVLSELPINELLELMMEDLYDGYAEEVVEEVEEALSREMTPYDVLTKGLVAGMEIVGIDFSGRACCLCRKCLWPPRQ